MLTLRNAAQAGYACCFRADLTTLVFGCDLITTRDVTLWPFYFKVNSQFRRFVRQKKLR